MLKSKIHQATLTSTDLNYEGSVAIDGLLMEAADILPGEQVHVLNVTNGSRLVTYAIAAEPDSAVVSLRGAAAHLGSVGDIVILVAYGVFEDRDAREARPSIVYVDARNHVKPKSGGNKQRSDRKAIP